MRVYVMSWISGYAGRETDLVGAAYSMGRAKELLQQRVAETGWAKILDWVDTSNTSSFAEVNDNLTAYVEVIEVTP